jgi:hypothetical protein
MSEPAGWDDPRKNPEASGGGRGRGLLRAPDEEPPSPRILKLALLAAAIIVVIALILYFKARKAPPALRNDLRTAPASLYVYNDSLRVTSIGKS